MHYLDEVKNIYNTRWQIFSTINTKF